jgi:hypothetical protein
MKKTNTILFAFLFSFFFTNAQKELWGYRGLVFVQEPHNVGINDGEIIKIPLEGSNSTPSVMHTFDVTGTNGKLPKGRLLQASNGKLYGVTSSYVYDGPVGPVLQNGVLFEYDPILSKYTVLSNALTGRNENEFGVIEVSPGILYGTTNNGNSIFKYNIATNTYSIAASIPYFINFGSAYFPKFRGELMKASDGYIYGVTDIAPSGPLNNDNNIVGGIYRFNPVNNQITKLFVFGYNAPDVNSYFPIYGTKLIEGAPGKLYGTTLGGDEIIEGISPLGGGTLFEFTIATNTIVKKFDFKYTSSGCNPSVLVKGANNKIYGTLYYSANQLLNYSGGSIFEYDTSTSALNIIHVMESTFNLVENFNLFTTALFASDGNFYPIARNGIRRYTINTNTIENKLSAINADDTQSFIEICRKPSYQEIMVNTFDGCVGSTFNYDVQNTNATTYQWQKNGIDVTGQTIAILTLTNLQTIDAGNYTCVMTNECGTTTTMPLHLTVNCLGTNVSATLEKGIKLYPNPTKNTVNIKLPENIEVTVNSIKIANSLGQIVIEYKADQINTIDVNKLQTGIYFINIKTNYGNWNGRFVKE